MKAKTDQNTRAVINMLRASSRVSALTLCLESPEQGDFYFGVIHLHKNADTL